MNQPLSKTQKKPEITAPRKPFYKKMLANYDLYLFCLIGIVVTIIFHYVPLYGVQIAFRNFSSKKGIWGSTWVGLKHFQRFFSSPSTSKLIWNTLSLSIYGMVAGFPIPIILALMLNSFRHKKYRKIIQSVTYAPYFISVIVMSGMLLLFLSPRVGVINTVIRMFGGTSVNFIGVSSMWRHIYIWSGVWQGMGFSSVIYFAALSGVSPEYHEAAIVDGATKFQRIRHIDFPFLMPVATILLILSFGGIMSVGFEKAFALQNPLNLEVSEIISTFTYKMGLEHNDMSYASAVGLFNTAVNFVLLVSVNKVTSLLSENSLW